MFLNVLFVSLCSICLFSSYPSLYMSLNWKDKWLQLIINYLNGECVPIHVLPEVHFNVVHCVHSVLTWVVCKFQRGRVVSNRILCGALIGNEARNIWPRLATRQNIFWKKWKQSGNYVSNVVAYDVSSCLKPPFLHNFIIQYIWGKCWYCQRPHLSPLSLCLCIYYILLTAWQAS